MSAETFHDSWSDSFARIRAGAQEHQKQKKSEAIPTFGTKSIDDKRSTVREMKQAAYFLIDGDTNVHGNDPRLSNTANFSKWVIDTIFELPEFLENIVSNPSLLEKIISKIHEMDIGQQLSEMFTKYDTPYDAGKSSANSILTLLGIWGIIKWGMSIIWRASDRVAKKATQDMLVAPSNMIGDTMVASREQTEAANAMMKAAKVRDVATNPALKSALSLGLDKLSDSLLRMAKTMDVLWPTLIQSEKIIKQMKEYMGKFPNTKDAAIIWLSLVSIEKNLSTILDRTSAQYSVEEDSKERKKIEINALSLIQDMLKVQFVLIPRSVIASIFK